MKAQEKTNLTTYSDRITSTLYSTIRVAGSMDLSGRATADETNRGLRVEKRSRSLNRIACYGLFGLAITLLPMTQALADADDVGQFVPLQVSTVPANGDQNPYGVAFVPPGFSAGGPLQRCHIRTRIDIVILVRPFLGSV